MPLLTFDNLNQNAYRYSDYLTYQRGMSYYQSGMGKPISKLFDTASVANLSPEGVHLFNLIIANSVNYTYIYSGIAVFIYKFIARDTVEEKILKLQEHKKELVDQLISAEGSFFKSITPDDVKVLFS